MQIAERFGLKVRIPCQVELASGLLTVPVLLEEFGRQRGMLLVTSYQDIAAATERNWSAPASATRASTTRRRPTSTNLRSSTCFATGVGPARAKRLVGTPPNKPLQQPNATPGPRERAFMPRRRVLRPRLLRPWYARRRPWRSLLNGRSLGGLREHVDDR